MLPPDRCYCHAVVDGDVDAGRDRAAAPAVVAAGRKDLFVPQFFFSC